ncbi:MAG: helix-turn-helix domain-containing protein [Prevotellaceae bacterium]|nr:helix-turn-helix domain-containing protein [Prevotellaceae bacterium]
MNINIRQLLENGTNITLSVDAKDLKEFAHQIITTTRLELEQDIAQAKSEVFYTSEQVVGILNVDKTTLWRWSKRSYLIPIKVGGLLRYRKSDIDRILNYGKAKHE